MGPWERDVCLPIMCSHTTRSGIADKTVLLEVHYNNVDGVTNETDNTALLVWHTDKPRTHGYDLCIHAMLRSVQTLSSAVNPPENEE
jgi:hypothetical protein